MSANTSNINTKQLVSTALMVALVLVGTILIRIPIPMTQGYVHLGDAMIYLGVLLLGKRDGTIAAGLGSAMGDILGGFAFWAPWTLVIKALMAFVSGLLIERAGQSHKHANTGSVPKVTPGDCAAMAVGGVIMSVGYFIAEGVMYGSWAAAALGLPWNAGQFIVGIIISAILYPLLSRAANR